MRILPHDQIVLDHVAAREAAIVGRAVDWAGVNSGSRNAAGLARMLDLLEAAAAPLSAEVTRLPTAGSASVGDDGVVREEAHADALRIRIRPEAPVQVVLTGHYDTVFPADSTFQTVTTRPDGALNGPGIADMKGGVSVMLAALEAFETHPDKAGVGWTVLLSPDEEIGSPASAPRLAERGARGHVGRAFDVGAIAVAGAAILAARLHALNGQRDGVTVNVAKIAGGGPLNVVADNAVVRFNVRVPDAAASDWVEAAVREIASEPPFPGLTLDLHGGMTRAPKPMDASQAALFEAVREAGALLDQTIAWKPSGGVCEGNNLHAAGLPNIDTLGVLGGDIHSDQEFAWPASFVERARLSALILCKIASGEIDALKLKALRLETL